MRVFLLLFLCLLSASQFPEDDRVDLTTGNYTGYPWYSGFLTLSRSKNFHYVFFTSQHDSNNDPIIMWFNGGPGCSSLLGMTTENGPFLFPKNSTEAVLNNYSWNKQANMLYIQSPGSVGFSLGPVESSDQSTANDNLNALISFFAKFPTMRKNQLYISGESYAGVYVPTLALEIHRHNSHSSLVKINLKGIIVGNACTHRSECYDPRPGTSLYQYEFLYKHAYYTASDYNRMRSVCVMGYNSTECKKIRKELDQLFDLTKSNKYGIYDVCYGVPPTVKFTQSGALRESVDCNSPIGSLKYFNDPLIREALHVNQYSTAEWAECSEQVSRHYTKNENQSYYIYPELMKAGYRVVTQWVYSGDTDADVPITGTKSWIQMLREQYHVPVMQPWREWWVTGKREDEDQVGGMVWKLRNLTMVTIRGAGHMAPQDKPEAAFAMINAYIKGEDLVEK